MNIFMSGEHGARSFHPPPRFPRHSPSVPLLPIRSTRAAVIESTHRLRSAIKLITAGGERASAHERFPAAPFCERIFSLGADPRITDPDLLTGYPAAYRRRVVEGSLLLLLLPRWNPGSHIAVGNPSSLVSSLRSGRAIDLASPLAFIFDYSFSLSRCVFLSLFSRSVSIEWRSTCRARATAFYM